MTSQEFQRLRLGERLTTGKVNGTIVRLNRQGYATIHSDPAGIAMQASVYSKRGVIVAWDNGITDSVDVLFAGAVEAVVPKPNRSI